MRKSLKFFTGFVIGAAVVMGIGAIAIYVVSGAKLRQKYAVKVPTVQAATTPDALARGQHLALTRGCVDCHGADLGGKLVYENGAMGRVDAPNLTRGRGGLPESYRDEDFVRAIRHGVAMDGRGLFLMPSIDYVGWSEPDMAALVGYLKTLPPVDRPRGVVDLGPIARLLTATGKIKLAAAEIDHTAVKPAVVSAGLTAEYGRYVADSCIGCHGANFSGGKIASGDPAWPPASNLTPHTDGKVKAWSEADFLQTLRTGRRPDGSEMHPAMPRAMGRMNDTELKALWMFLRTVPAVATGVR